MLLPFPAFASGVGRLSAVRSQGESRLMQHLEFAPLVVEGQRYFRQLKGFPPTALFCGSSELLQPNASRPS